MKRSLPALALASAVLAGCQSDAVGPRVAAPSADVLSGPSAAVRGSTAGEVIPGHYVVLFRRGRVLAGAPTTVSGAPTTAEGAAALAAESGRLAARKLAGGRGVLLRSFGHAVQGFAATLSDAAVAALRADPDVALVEPDHVVHATGGVETSAPWGLDRIDQQWEPLDGQYHYAGDGSGTSVYVIDTGINQSHVDFGGRAVAGMDFVTAGGAATDCHGHGTHVAGTVGGAQYGVAKGARIVAVRVLDCSGSGSSSDVVAALDWVAQQHQAAPAVPAVANMSLGGDAVAALDSAVARTTAAGVTVVVAAGNAGIDACTSSPARAPQAIAVGATDASDNWASFSNYGSCVALEAPGVAVVSDFIGSSTATATMSGTSMASPHVAGAAALYLAANPTATPAQVATALVSHAVGGPLQGVPANTPSRLLDVDFLAGTSAAPRASDALVGAADGLCLDLNGGSAANGTRVQMWTCYGGSANQQFILPAVGTVGPIRHVSGMCLDALQGGTSNGEIVGVWVCNGGSHQRWTVTSAGQVQDAATGLCLDIDSGGRANGTKVQLWACYAGSANQRWSTR